MDQPHEKVEVTSTSQTKTDAEEWEETSESESEPVKKINKPVNNSKGARNLRSWLNLPLRIEMTDKRILVGMFLCTDRDANVILGSCSEYLPECETTPKEEPRMLGLIMVPGKHIVSICIDQCEKSQSTIMKPTEEIL